MENQQISQEEEGAKKDFNEDISIINEVKQDKQEKYFEESLHSNDNVKREQVQDNNEESEELSKKQIDIANETSDNEVKHELIFQKTEQQEGIQVNNFKNNEKQEESNGEEDHRKEEEEEQDEDKKSQGSNGRVSDNNQKSEEDSSDDSGSDFDFEKIKARVASQSSGLPKWFLEANDTINKHGEKVKEVNIQFSDLGKGLKDFENKRQVHISKLKEDRLKWLAKKYGIAEKQEDRDERFKNPFYSLNQYILLKIVQFSEGDLVGNFLKMAQVSRKFLHLLAKEDLWKNICSCYIGKPFTELNEKNQEQFEKVNNSNTQNQKSLSNLITINHDSNANSLNKTKQQSFNYFKKGFWQNLSFHFYLSFNRFSKALQDYRQQNCPLIVEHNLRSNLIQGLRLVNEIFSITIINQNKSFGLYIKIMKILKDQYIKGAYCLWRLASTNEENIRYEAFDALFSLLSLEPSEIQKLSLFCQLSHFLHKCSFDFEKRTKALFTTEVQQVSSILPSMFQKTNQIIYMVPSIIYNSRFQKQSYDSNQKVQCNYDIQDNALLVKQINDRIKLLGSSDLPFEGIYLQRDSNTLFELKGKITIQNQNINGFGITSCQANQIYEQEENSGDNQINFTMSGAIKFNHNYALRKSYEILISVPHFGKGNLFLTLGSRPDSPSKFEIFSCFSYTISEKKNETLDEEQSSMEYEPIFTLYGASENTREVILLRI